MGKSIGECLACLGNFSKVEKRIHGGVVYVWWTDGEQTHRVAMLTIREGRFCDIVFVFFGYGNNKPQIFEGMLLGEHVSNMINTGADLPPGPAARAREVFQQARAQ